MTEVVPSFEHAATTPSSLSCWVRKFVGNRKIAEELVRKRSCEMACLGFTCLDFMSAHPRQQGSSKLSDRSSLGASET